MNNEKNKRIRIGEKTPKETVVEELDVKIENTEIEEDANQAFYDENGEFMWDAYESTCPSRTRKPNPHIKTKDGDKVYSRESYAQEMYDMLTAHDASIGQLLTVINPGEIHEGKIYAINSEFISVDIGYRELIYVKYDKEHAEIQ